jgi:hypothetical protein
MNFNNPPQGTRKEPMRPCPAAGYPQGVPLPYTGGANGVYGRGTALNPELLCLLLITNNFKN